MFFLSLSPSPLFFDIVPRVVVSRGLPFRVVVFFGEERQGGGGGGGASVNPERSVGEAAFRPLTFTSSWFGDGRGPPSSCRAADPRRADKPIREFRTAAPFALPSPLCFLCGCSATAGVLTRTARYSQRVIHKGNPRLFNGCKPCVGVAILIPVSVFTHCLKNYFSYVYFPKNRTIMTIFFLLLLWEGKL